MDRVTVPEAAERLGISENAVRKRVQRNTIEWDRDADGRVYVYLSPTKTDYAGDQATDKAADQDLLITRLENEVEYLRREVEDWKEAARRKDTIIMTMAQRIPELEAPQEPRERRETAFETPGSTAASPKRRKPFWAFWLRD